MLAVGTAQAEARSLDAFWWPRGPTPALLAAWLLAPGGRAGGHTWVPDPHPVPSAQEAARSHQQQTAHVPGKVPAQTETALQRPPHAQDQVLRHVAQDLRRGARGRRPGEASGPPPRLSPVTSVHLPLGVQLPWAPSAVSLVSVSPCVSVPPVSAIWRPLLPFVCTPCRVCVCLSPRGRLSLPSCHAPPCTLPAAPLSGPLLGEGQLYFLTTGPSSAAPRPDLSWHLKLLCLGAVDVLDSRRQ